MRAVGQWLLLLAMALTIASSAPTKPVAAAREAAPLLQSAQLSMISPTGCPSAGCASGQRLNMSFAFQPSGVAANDPNVKVCIYAPTAWKIDPASVSAAALGEITDKPYTPDAANPGCPEDKSKPSGYTLIVERIAALDVNTFSDALGFAFRITPLTAGKGQVLARLFEITSSGGSFGVTRQATTSTINVGPPNATAYIANDPAACGINGPCYVNSGEDYTVNPVTDVGTGLKDAVDAVSAIPAADPPVIPVLRVIGTYLIKSSTVVIDKALTLEGQGNATITYNGPSTCAKTAMLELKNAVTVRNLIINDGNCADPGRDLIRVNSDKKVLIESNTLTKGDNGIRIIDNVGPVTVQFNAVTGNAGHAIYWEGKGDKPTPLTVTANNLQANGEVPAIECASDAGTTVSPSHTANHNYWGTATPGTDTHCVIVAGRRLGMAIAAAEDGSGVNARLVTVSGNRVSAFNNEIGYKRTGGTVGNTGDFPLFIVDHGYMTTGGPPFSYVKGEESPSPCSNYWDVFLPDNEPGSGTLELYLNYDKTPGCIAVINSNQYCDQTATVSKYPLFWYDPTDKGVTKAWDTTGGAPENQTSLKGQTTTCHIDDNEIQVSIDTSGRPNLDDDLHAVPLMVGVPVLKSFTPLASSKAITVTWTTNNEPDINGFYVLRGTDRNNLSPISDLIQHTGSALVGKYYAGIVDSGRTNGATYFYRLQIVRTDGTSIYSNIVEIQANAATITPTVTPLPTRTRTPVLPTSTPRPTLKLVQAPTKKPTNTATPRKTPIAPPTSLFLPTLTPTYDLRTPGIAATLTIEAKTLQAIVMGSLTPLSETGTPSADDLLTGTPVGFFVNGTFVPQGEGTPPATTVAGASGTSAPNPWLSLLLGLLAGSAAIGGAGGFWYWRMKQ